MPILSKPQLCSLNPIQPSEPMVICCSDLDMLKHTKITPAINDSSLWWNKGVCQPSHIVIYFGYKGIVYRIEIVATSISYLPARIDFEFDGIPLYDWRIDIWEMNNREVNRFGSFLESHEVPISHTYFLLHEKLFETEDFYA